MPGTIILDEQFNKIVPKPINNRPGYDMKYVSAYIVNYCYGTDLKKIIGIEWEYDTLSVVKPGQSLIAWAVSSVVMGHGHGLWTSGTGQSASMSKNFMSRTFCLKMRSCDTQLNLFFHDYN